MKQKIPQKTKEEFQAWWTRTFGFSTEALYYKNYRALYFKGANLDYIRSCHELVQAGDAVKARANEQRREAKKVKRRKRQIEHAAPVPKALESAIKKYYRGYIDSAFEKAKEINPADPLLSLPLSRPLTPPLLLPPLTPRDVYVARRVEQLRREATEHAWAYAIELVRSRRKEERKKVQREVEAFEKQNPIAEVIKEYAPVPGRSEDLRGSFFLVAVTEHLKEETESGLTQAWVVRFLRKISPPPENKESSLHQDSVNPKARIYSLKNSHDWERHLELIKKQLLTHPH